MPQGAPQNDTQKSLQGDGSWNQGSRAYQSQFSKECFISLRSPAKDENDSSRESSHGRTVILNEVKDLLCLLVP